MKLFLFVFQFFLCFNIIAQNISLTRTFDSSTYYINNSPTANLILNLSNCPKENESQVLIALSYFPDLKCKEIIFKKRKINTTLNARPTIGSLIFSKRKNRTYVIRINSTTSDSVISLKNIPFNAEIGLFAHEFSHFLDYQSRSVFGIIARGISYSNKTSKAKFEKEIDLQTIKKGLGWQLYDWSNYVQNESNATGKYKQFKYNTYMTPLEILKVIQPLTVQ
ncbi:MAG: hypothetical protein RI883_609 [Bacteroidota bacterium]|jgi:hypothetical protein